MSATFTNHHLEIIRRLCLDKAGVKSITPSHCRILSFLIMKDTGLCISETTLKRLFGLALSKYSPSLFTINTLAVYCGFDGWDSFCRLYPVKKLLNNVHPSGWYNLASRAREASDFTLQALKNKSGVPFRHTIVREFMDDFIRNFDKSGLTGAVITAPAGYGKTIALCRWLEKQPDTSDDIILLYSSVTLMSVLHGGKNMDDWMQLLLGFHTKAAFHEITEGRENSKFFLVLDGMDDHMLKKEQFHLLLNQLLHLQSFYRQFDWFKLVLTMRNTTWINYKHELELGEIKIFTDYRENDECINVPLFSYREVQLLNSDISERSLRPLNIEQAEIFRHPMYFQYYYQMHKGTVPADRTERITAYELHSLFILNKVYVGYYAVEKVFIIEQLADLIDFKDDNYQVEKMKVIDILNQHDQAFRELLGTGLLSQINYSTSHKFVHYIKFSNPAFVFHTIAGSMLSNNNDIFDEELIARINDRFGKRKEKIQVLKWCIMHALKTGQRAGFQHLSGAGLSLNEKSDLVLFLGDLLENAGKAMMNEEFFWKFFNEDAGDRLFDFFFGLELFNKDYKATLNTLLNFELSNYKKIIIYATLGVNAVIDLDMKELEKQIISLKKMDGNDYAGFIFNPLHCLELIFEYLKCCTVRSDLLHDLTKNALRHRAPLRYFNAASDLVLLFGLYTCCKFLPVKHSEALLRKMEFSSVIQNGVGASSAFNFFSRMIAADIYFRAENHGGVNRIFTEVTASYGSPLDLLTPYMETLMLCLKIKLMLISGKSDFILLEIKGLRETTELSGSRLTKLCLDYLISKDEELISKYPKLKKELEYDIMKVISEQGLSRNLLFF